MHLDRCCQVLFRKSIANYSLCYNQTGVGEWKSATSITLILLIGPFLLALVVSYWWQRVRLPGGWRIYTNVYGQRYSFAHPKDWIVSECGNGEVVVARRQLDRCYYPLEAPEEYLNDVYFQVFLPNHFIASVHTGLAIPERLQAWNSVSWVLKEEFAMIGLFKNWQFIHIWGTSIPVKPIATTSYSLYAGWRPMPNRGNDALAIAYPDNSFTVGFIPRSSYMRNLKKVIQSIRWSD